MRSLRAGLWALAVLGLVAGGAPLGLALANELGHQRELIALAGPITGWAFVGTGIYVWWRRPESIFGALMTAVGFSACLASLRVATDPATFITGLIFIALPYAVLYHMLLAFPTGRVPTRFQGALVVTGYASALVAHPLQVLLQDTAPAGLPPNPLLLVALPEVVGAISRLRFAVGLLLILVLLAIVVVRVRDSTPNSRRRLLPVVLTSGAVFALFAAWYVAVLFGASALLQEGLEWARVIALATVPFGFLIGVLHSRVAGASATSDLIARFGAPKRDSGGLREELARGLEDPSLELAYWLPEEDRYVDLDGRPVAIPDEGDRRTATLVEREGQSVGAFIHDASLDQEPERLRAAAAAVALALDNERLHAELRARLAELSASRRRIVQAGDDERKRIERNLHDSTQQRLTSVAMTLGLVQAQMKADPHAADNGLRQARDGLAAALAELRSLSQGIHPGILTERGLTAAVEDLAYANPLPIRVTGSLTEVAAEPAEAAAYYVVAEALANVNKHARASGVQVDLREVPGQLIVAVSDDGVGGADASRGTGLRGLSDRIQALGGSLRVHSPKGAGTRLTAVIPRD